MQKQSPLQKYKNLSKIYDQVWILLVVIVLGIIIMQLISGNLKSDRVESALNQEPFRCPQTQLSEVTPLPSEPLETNMQISIINTKTELVQTAQIKNSIAHIANPQFGSLEELSDCLDNTDEFIAVTIDSETRLYPKRLLAQHLIINDVIKETPILVSYCVLCDAIKVYERTVGDTNRVFGTTGLLYKNSDVFYDDKTESLWSQFTGQAIAGEDTTKFLTPLTFRIITYSKAKEEFDHAKVMNFITGYRANYADQSYREFGTIEKIVAPITNRNNVIPDKTEILGFEVGEKYYAVESLRIKQGEKFEVESKELSGTVDSGEISLQLDSEQINYTKSFWYVWYDFHPDTVFLPLASD